MDGMQRYTAVDVATTHQAPAEGPQPHNAHLRPADVTSEESACRHQQARLRQRLCTPGAPWPFQDRGVCGRVCCPGAGARGGGGFGFSFFLSLSSFDPREGNYRGFSVLAGTQVWGYAKVWVWGRFWLRLGARFGGADELEDGIRCHPRARGVGHSIW